MNWKPNKWCALVLSMIPFLSPLGLLYVDAPRRAALFVVVALSAATLFFFHPFGSLSMLAGTLTQVVLIVGCMAFSYRRAAHAQLRRARPWYTRWLGLTAIAVAAMLVFSGFRIFLYDSYRAPSASMAPAVVAGSNLLVQKWGYGHFSTYGITFGSGPISAPLKRGDIIVFDYPLDPTINYVKRVVGLPGDKIVYRDNQLFVNGTDTRVRQLSDYLREDTMHYSSRFLEKLDDAQYDILLDKETVSRYPAAKDFELKDKCTFDAGEIRCDVPAGRYFVLGDNRGNSLDSRQWGFVRAEHVIGKVVKIIP